MTLIIVLLLIFGCLLIATGHITNINKAAIAMFMGAVGWVIYICYGNDFVLSQHPAEYAEYLKGTVATSERVKLFICNNIFIKYVGKAAGIVLFLLATMTIVEILNNNGCFDFISEWIRTRNSKRLLWTISLATFVISANLDNLTTTTMMLVIMHGIVQSRRQRMIIGAVIVLAANCGGCMTVIGDALGLVMWGDGRISASHFSAYLFLPSLAAWIIPTYFLGRQLPSRLDVEWPTSPYRGDDTNLNRWQRFVMLVVGIGGLWFIPTFHNITKLTPFLGALCVLSILWVVNEIFNRKLMNADQMIQRRFPRVLQYGAIQQMLFVMGILLAIGVVTETGFFAGISKIIDNNNIWLIGIIAGLMSSFIDTFTIAMTGISLYTQDITTAMPAFVTNGAYWKIIAFSTTVGGSILCFGSASGLALMKMERMRVGWYFKHCTPHVLAGWGIGLLILWLEITLV